MINQSNFVSSFNLCFDFKVDQILRTFDSIKNLKISKEQFGARFSIANRTYLFRAGYFEKFFLDHKKKNCDFFENNCSPPREPCRAENLIKSDPCGTP